MESQHAQPTMPATPAQLPGLGQLLQRSWTAFSARILKYIGITLLPMLVIAAIGLIATVGTIAFRNSLSFGVLIVAGIVGIAIFIALIVLQLWQKTALLYVASHTEESVGVMDAYRRSWKLIAGFFWLSLLTGLILFGASVFFVIPAIVFSVWFIFAAFVFVREGDTGMKALLKSKEYVRGYWWAVFGRFFALYVILVLVFSVLSFLTDKSPVLGVILTFLLSWLLVPFVLTYLNEMYVSLKQIKGTVTAGSGRMIAGISLLGYAFVIIGIALFFSTIQSLLQNARSDSDYGYDSDYPYSMDSTSTADDFIQRITDENTAIRLIKEYKTNMGYYPPSIVELNGMPLFDGTQDFLYKLEPDGSYFEVCFPDGRYCSSTEYQPFDSGTEGTEGTTGYNI